MAEFALHWWPALAGAVGVIGWLFRMEALTRENQKQTMANRAEIAAVENRLEKKLDKAELDRHEARREQMSSMNEMRNDIKQILMLIGSRSETAER